MKPVSHVQHFLITRFNQNVSFVERPLHLDAAWLADRFKLFEAFCLPSVRAQSSQNFQWIVLFHPDTPGVFQERIAELQKTLPLFQPEFLGGAFEPEAVAATVRRHVAKHTTHVITSRVDNDDCLADRYIQTVQNRAVPG